MKTFYFVKKNALLLSFLIPMALSAQQPTTVVMSSNCNFTYTFNTTDEGFSSPSIYSDANDFGLYWTGSNLSETIGSAITPRTASCISGIFFNSESNRATVGFDYSVPLGTEYRIRIISAITNPPLEILATTANGPIWSSLPGTSGSLCLELQDLDLPLNSQMRYEITFRTIAPGPITLDNFRRISFNSPLPVTFLGFIARESSNGGIKLLWNVAQEDNVSGYEVQTSNDGINFSVAGYVGATAKDNYSFIYNQPITGALYFRVRNVDFNNDYKYTGIIKVNAGDQPSIVKAYPVPAGDQLYLEHPKTNQRASIMIVNAEGKIMMRTFTTPGSFQTSLRVGALRPGIYFIRYEDEIGVTQSIRFVKN